MTKMLLASRLFTLALVVTLVQWLTLIRWSRDIQLWWLDTRNTSETAAISRSTKHSTVHASASTKNVKGWYRKHEWRRNCFTVENLCHHDGRFFYRTDGRHHQTQPPFILYQHTRWIEERNYTSRHPMIFNVTANGQEDTEECVDSFITNHMVISSDFNDMLAEVNFELKTSSWH